MTALLERAFAAASELPDAEQDALAARVLKEIEDEKQWTVRFEATTDAQWDALAEMARRSIGAGGDTPSKHLCRAGAGEAA
jgi:hypothetical protein